jgi:hypothetical protein
VYESRIADGYSIADPIERLQAAPLNGGRRELNIIDTLQWIETEMDL